LEVFVYCSRIDAPSNEVFAWHSREDAFERLIPHGGDLSLLKTEKRRRRKKGIDTSNGSYVTLLFKCP
jgi:ligand-binding SRPBCC domain-containing protein